MRQVLFVCLGNICRSPLAEAIFNHKIREKGLSEVFFGDSCGTADYHIGDPPDPRTIKSAEKNGIRISHKCRQLGRADLDRFEFIFVMDQDNLHQARRLAGKAHVSKIKLMRSYDPEGADMEVPDPYYGTEKDFQKVYEILDRSIEAFLREEGR